MSKMLEEIREQPAALERTLKAELRGFEQLRARFAKERPKFIVLAARGTSDNAAQFGRYLIEIATGIPVSLSAPSVTTLYQSKLQMAGGLLAAVSQSGESTDTNVVLEEAKRQGAFTVGITNEASSTLARISDHVALVRAGREKSVAATKTYTGQILAFYLLAWALGADLDIDDLRRLPGWAADALKLEKEMSARADRFRFMNHAVVIGRGLNYSTAFEWALKMMETSYVIAERFSQADLLHGPIAMVEQGFPAFVLTPSGVTWPAMKEMIAKLDSLQAETLVVTDRSNREAPKSAVRIPAVLSYRPKKGRAALPQDLYTPIPYIIPAQMFAAALAKVKGFDADKPRGLSKVTLTL